MTTKTYLPDPPRSQCLSSTTFRPPPMDGSLTLPEMWEWHRERTTEHPIFVYAAANGSMRTVYWPEAVSAMRNAARIVRGRMIGAPPGAIVAIVAPSDFISYCVSYMGILRANFAAFLISPRNSPIAIAHLLKETSVKHILIGRDPAISDLVEKSLDILKSQVPGIALPSQSSMPLFGELFEQPQNDVDDLPSEFQQDMPVLLLHSSGSTAFPKVIPRTHKQVVALGLIPWFGQVDMTGKILSMHILPFFHGMGVMQASWTATCGIVLSVFEPQMPIPPPNPVAIFAAIKATNTTIIFSVPAIIEVWSKTSNYVDWLATRLGVLFGGGPLNKEVGDYLTSQGVSVFNLYGCSEGGVMSIILPDAPRNDWEYFTFSQGITPKLVPYGDNTSEFTMIDNAWSLLAKTNTFVGSARAYNTADLLEPHPTKQGYWKVYGRSDDQVMHSTGEKTNPGPLESILNQDPHVQSAVIFGRGQFQAGVIIEPKPPFKFDPSEEVKLAAYRNMIWPSVERMNTYAPQHSRIFKEMILVAKPSKPFTYTAKNTARRQAVINDYEEEINVAYDQVEESTQSDIPPPVVWDPLHTRDFVAAVVAKVLDSHLDDDADIFHYGCDSLQATYIRNALLRALRDSAQLDTRHLVSNFVYDYPSVAQLSVFLASLASGQHQTIGRSPTSKADDMRALATKYGSSFSANRSRHEPLKPVGSHSVLLTGTTGALGSNLLARLVSQENISKVYALNRSKGGVSLLERQRASLVTHGLSVGLLDSKKVLLLEGDLATHHFGLEDDVYQEVANAVTIVIHNAWRVDFNLALVSFEPNIKGLRSLIDFALSSPRAQAPRILFTSTIGIFQKFQRAIAEEAHVQADVAVGTGYTESKWVAEEILREATSKTALEATIVRVGQISGGIKGDWNISEWFPSLVQSASKLGCFPDVRGTVDWIPLELAAKAMLDFSVAPALPSVLHLVHPRPVAWSTLADSISSELSVSKVSFAAWLTALEGAADGNGSTQSSVELLRDLRALRLLDFFRDLARRNSESSALGFPKLASTNATACSQTLEDPELRTLGKNDVHEWITYWRGEGLLPQGN